MTTQKSAEAFRTISEVAQELDLPQHVLRFWETKFSQVKPMKRGGGRRYYRPGEVDLLRGIRHLLYVQGYTIKGAQKVLGEHGVRFVAECWQEGHVSADSVVAEETEPDAPVPETPVYVDPPAAPIAAPSGAGKAPAVNISPETKRALRSVLVEMRAARDLLQTVQAE